MLFRDDRDAEPADFGDCVIADTAEGALDQAVARNPGWPRVGVARILDANERMEAAGTNTGNGETPP